LNKIGVIGAGKWGQALHFAFSQNKNNSVFITSRTKRKIRNFVSIDEILKNEYLVFVISTQSVSNWLKNNFVFKNQKVLIASKGIDIASNKLLTDIFEEYIPKENIAFLSGPSFAKEVQRSLPTALVVNSTNESLAQEFAQFFPDFIKIYTDSDIIGAEIAGAYKNILAIASGVCDGLQLGNNARASLISRGLVEMERFGESFGSKKETFISLSGAGDLFLTASSTMSRNYRVGFELAKNRKLDEILEELGETAEGVKTVKAICQISEKKGLYVPIAREVKAIVDGKSPLESLKALLKQ
jgi:glycerol-3-phosphate dehydrogenase (NAD(P)+)